ncbi:hypothetical protein, partial [Rhizobium ruizarguesonis]|uniref:hypothetical protein n=1 Tax=Rhizobium ruizarguesonis TaxID=2081791 RepID=UPI001AEEBF40
CSSVYGRLSIDISSKGFSTLLAMILLTPQHQLNRLSNLTRRPQRYFLDRSASDRAYGVASQIINSKPKLDTRPPHRNFSPRAISRRIIRR